MNAREMNLGWARLVAAMSVAAMAWTSFPVAAQGSLNPAAAAIAAAGRAEAGKQPAAEPAEVAGSPTLPATRDTTSKAGPAGAGIGSVLPGRVTEASELAALQSQYALWKVRAEIAKLKAEVRRNEEGAALATGLPALPSGVSLPGPVPMQRPIEQVQAMASDAPRLLSLRAFDGDYNAVVEVGGRAMPVQAGDRLEGGWKVVTVDDDGVKLANGKRVRMLRP